MIRDARERQFATQLAILSRQWRLLGDQALIRLGVSNSSGWCLVYIQRLGESARQSDLARAVGVRESTLVRTLNGLEESGLVERTPHPHDARVKLTRLTVKGTAIVRQVEDSLMQLRQELLAETTDTDLAAALRVQEQVASALAERQCGQ